MADEAYTDVNYKSICCEQIPELFLDKLVAKKHFSKFGKIKRFILRPKRLSCTVEYETEEEAENAFEEAGEFNGIEFVVKYAEREVGHVQNTEEWVDADVQSELDAMGGRQQAVVTKKMPTPQLKVTSWPKATSKPVGKETVSPVSAPPKFDSAVRSELETMLRQPASTAEEKYRVLDARDKLIRLLSIKQTDIAKAERRKGICPDMCPEKERLMRDFQRQVSVFEINKSSLLGSISHRRAVKEYSRSSADQEVPLLHELRSESVLKLTMLYLMHNIMDQLDSPQVSVSDWFHFVWDRTRSIRKDITQQELCSLEAVELVEQCARFHIHCGARLVAEEPSVFDKKINAENLTKCLQTLKYLYHDLRLKNVRCPREAEFRGYIVLLNLGNSNFLWEIKQLPEDLQQSQEIKRAMEFYNVLQNNNYVRFFNMVREQKTTYLCACILLNYFTKLRICAMEAIVKSHNWRKDPVFLPLEYLTRILGFEDENAAVHFFGYHGLEVSEQRGVMLDRLTPASDYIMDRALKLVESKRTVSVGECVCGHPLDSPEIFETHQPHNSFDENGLLKLEAWTADDQLRGEAAVAKAKERKEKQAQMLQQSQQQGTTPPQPVSQPAQSLFTTQTNKNDNIFKIPQLSPQPSPRQSQQLSPQQQFIQKSTTGGFSLFNKAVSAVNTTSNKNLFLPKTTVETAASTSPATSLFKSSGGSLFTTLSPSFSTDSIFGKVGTSTTSASNSLFANNLNSTVTSVPRDDNVFQYFQMPEDNFGPPKSIFGAPQMNLQADLEAEKQRQKAEREADELEAKKREEAASHKLALEIEEARMRKQAEEDQQRRESEAAHAAAAAEQKRRLEDFQSRAINAADDFVSKTVDVEIAKIAKNELSIYQKIAASSAQLTEQLIDEYILEQVTNIATAEYNIICHDRMLLERYFTIWLNATRKKILQRHLLETTPMWVPAETQEQIAEQLQHPSMSLNLHMIKRYRHGEPCDFRNLLWDDDEDLRWRQSVDVFDMIAKHIATKMPIRSIQERVFYKLLFTLPSEKQELYGFESLCNKWLRVVLRFPQKQSNENSTPSYINSLQQNVALCVRKVSGTPPINEAGQPATNAECDHIDGVLFFMTCVDLAQTRRRLHHLLQASKNFKRLPITFIVYGGTEYDESELTAALDLLYLVEKNKVSTYRFYNCHGQKADHRFKLILEHALNYVIDKSFELNVFSDDLVMQSTQQWLETCLGEEMWRRWQASWLQNPIFGKVCSLFPHVVGLYNAAIDHLISIIKTSFEQAPEFPIELRRFVPKWEDYHSNLTLGLPYFPDDWKSKHRQQRVINFIQRLALPSIETEPPADINELKLWLLNYAGQCIPYDDEKATTAAYYAIKSLIEQLTSEDLEFLEIPKRMCLINYLPVVKVFAFAHINEQLQMANKADGTLPTEIIYNRKSLQLYLEPWWLNYEAVEAVNVDCSTPNDETQEDLENTEDPLDEIEAALEKAEQISQRFEEKMNARQQKEKQENCSNSNDLILRRMNQIVHEIETAEKAGVYDFANLKRTHRKRSRNNNEAEELTSVKRKQQDEHPSETDDVIAKACAVIEKVNAFRDIEFRLDYITSKLDI